MFGSTTVRPVDDVVVIKFPGCVFDVIGEFYFFNLNIGKFWVRCFFEDLYGIVLLSHDSVVGLHLGEVAIALDLPSLNEIA